MSTARSHSPPPPLEEGGRGFDDLPLLPLPAWKRTLDLVAASVALVLAAPLVLVLLFAIRLETPGGALYVHERIGRGGVSFRCWKFRSMHLGADRARDALSERNERDGPIFKMRHDPRVTRLGRLMRRLSLDELPQLWNVLRGDMSLVGPRPPLPHEVDEYTPRHRQRLAGTPGLTGLWQVTARSHRDFEEMVDLDLEYLDDVTLRRDLAILARTVWTVLRADGSY